MHSDDGGAIIMAVCVSWHVATFPHRHIQNKILGVLACVLSVLVIFLPLFIILAVFFWIMSQFSNR